MATLLSVPVLILALIAQMVVVNRLPLLYGSADLVLLTVIAWALQPRVRTAWIWALFAGIACTFISALPLYLPVVIYLIATGIARLIQRRVWQSPILALLVTVVSAALIQNLLSIMGLQLMGTPITWQQGLSLITLPSLLLNLLLALPVYTVINDLANWVYPPAE